MEYLLVEIILALIIVVGLAGYKIGYSRGRIKEMERELDRQIEAIEKRVF